MSREHEAEAGQIHMVRMRRRGIFVGLSTVDILYAVAHQSGKNEKVTADSQQIIVGGPATNAAVTFAHFGGDTTLVTPAGRHLLSELVKEECRKFEVELIDLTPESDVAPPLSSICVDVAGLRSVVSANTMGRVIPPAEVDEAWLREAQILMVDGHAMQACEAWAEAARRVGVCVVFDGGSWKAGTDLLLRNLDIAICSGDFRPPGCMNGRDAVRYLQAAGVQKVAITGGADPIEWVSEAGSGVVEVPRVEAVDTTGAGDVFHGAFCFYYAMGEGFEESLQKAGAVASESCRYRGTREWMLKRSAAVASIAG